MNLMHKVCFVKKKKESKTKKTERLNHYHQHTITGTDTDSAIYESIATYNANSNTNNC